MQLSFVTINKLMNKSDFTNSNTRHIHFAIETDELTALFVKAIVLVENETSEVFDINKSFPIS